MVLLKMKAVLRKSLLAKKTLDPRCSRPVTIKNTKETFLIFVMVFEEEVFIDSVDYMLFVSLLPDLIFLDILARVCLMTIRLDM